MNELRANSQALSAERWQELLALELAAPVRVVYTRARRTPLQVRPARTRQGLLEVRMHDMFAAAPPEMARAIASWIRSGPRAPRACTVLDRWIEESLGRLPPRKLARAAHTRGTHHDLDVLATELFAHEFAHDFAGTEARPRITWGRRTPSRTRHSLRLGSYDPDGRVARIHPVLDQGSVPPWFVRYVLFHELLHAAHPPRKEGERWIHHGAEFRARERRYVDYARALAWEARNIRALIRSARRGTAVEARELELAAPKAAPVTAAVKLKPRGFWQQLLF